MQNGCLVGKVWWQKQVGQETFPTTELSKAPLLSNNGTGNVAVVLEHEVCPQHSALGAEVGRCYVKSWMTCPISAYLTMTVPFELIFQKYFMWFILLSKLYTMNTFCVWVIAFSQGVDSAMHVGNNLYGLTQTTVETDFGL